MKDHAIECDGAYWRDKRGTRVAWSRNYLPKQPSFSDGATETSIEMSVEELNSWSHSTDMIESYLSQAESSASMFVMEKGFPPTERAMEYVTAARHSENLAFKVAYYCSGFSSLFAPDSRISRGQLADRVARFLQEHGCNSRTVPEAIKRACHVRAKVVVGAPLSAGEVSGLPDLSMECDTYLRTVLNTIFRSEALRNMFDSSQASPIDWVGTLRGSA